MKVLGIVCSPRKGGNTARLVESVLDGARMRGAETEIFNLGDLRLNPCRVCNDCESSGRCSQEDDMQRIYRAIDSANFMVLGTPIYHDHVSAQAKALTDRLYAYEWKDSFPRDMRAVVVVTYEWDNPTGYDKVVEWIEETLKRYYRVETVKVLKACNTSKIPVAQRPELLREARAIGEGLIQV